MIQGLQQRVNPTYFDNEPANTALFGQSVTVMADLSFYRNQILTLMVPEPSAALLAGGALAFMLHRTRRRSVR